MGKMLQRDDRGFTLIELMMVIVILGILVGVAVPLVGSARSKAEENKAATILDTVATAVQINAFENNKVPENAEAVHALITDLPSNFEIVDTAKDTASGGKPFQIVYTKDTTKDPNEWTLQVVRATKVDTPIVESNGKLN